MRRPKKSGEIFDRTRGPRVGESWHASEDAQVALRNGYSFKKKGFNLHIDWNLLFRGAIADILLIGIVAFFAWAGSAGDPPCKL